MTEFIESKILALYKTEFEENFLTTEVHCLEVDFGGIPGDRHYGLTRITGKRDKKEYPIGSEVKNHRQLSLLDSKELEHISSGLGLEGKIDVLPELLGTNILLEHVPNFTTLPRYSKIRVISNRPKNPSIILYGENLPCINPGIKIEEYYGNISKSRFPRAAHKLRGQTGWITARGILQNGDRVIITPYTPK